MALPMYRDRRGEMQAGDLARGWLDAGCTEEICGVVVAMKEDTPNGANCTLAVLECDEFPRGTEPPSGEHLAPGQVAYKSHDGTPCTLTVRMVECHAERLELAWRRARREGFRGLLKESDPGMRAMRERQADEERRAHERSQFVPPRDDDAGRHAAAFEKHPPEMLPEAEAERRRQEEADRQAEEELEAEERERQGM
jgi:hypothetical protein